MKDDPINADEPYEPYEQKRTRKRKAPVIPVTNRSTRHGHRKHSSDECPLPEVVPLSEGLDLLLFQSFQQQLTRIVLQIPYPLLTAPAASATAFTRVEATPIQIEVQSEGGNIACSVMVAGEIGEESALVIHGKYSWLGEGEVICKHIKGCRRVIQKGEWTQVLRFKPEAAKSDGFVYLTLKWEERVTRLYRGLVNQGNTCYMNSYLQMLFHLTEFRKLLFAAQVKEKDRFPATLQLLFYRMLSEQKPVSPEQLVRSFGWSKKQVQVQHDAQEFSCLFFDALQRTVIPVGGPWGSVPDLFCGQLIHYIQCCNVGTTEFRTQNRERFYDLQLPLAPTLAHALHDYVGEQKLEGDNAYRTDYYGLQDAHKGLILSTLPPVLMLQLKRFQFNPFSQANQKVLQRCAYPENIDFAPWTVDPSTPRPYDLYAVLVHEGSQANSGHYYVFIKLEGKWFRFNDERVQQVDRAHALDYNFGGESDVVDYESKQMKVVQKQVKNNATAYMLVYLSNEYRQQLAQDDNRLPEWLVEHTKMKVTLDEEKKIRKQSICDIPLLRWKNFEFRQCLGSGLAVDEEQGVDEKIQMVPKNMRVEEWLQHLQKKGEDNTLYILWTAMEKEIMVNIRTRTCGTVSQLFKEITDPTLFFAPIDVIKEQFLVIVKIYDPKATPKFFFGACLSIMKDSRKGDLFSLLTKAYPPEPTTSYYLEDKKQGLLKLGAGDTSLLPAASPSKNQLLIAVVQVALEGEGVNKLYQQQLDTISVVFKCQSTKETIQMQLSKRFTVREAKEILFNEIQKDYENIKSPDNIVLKYKAKRNAKPIIEAKDDETLAELVKVDKVVIFAHSALSTAERHLLRQITLHCRDQSLHLSEAIKIVVEKAEQEKLLDLLQQNEQVKALLPQKKDMITRSFLLGRDRSFITDVVDENGRVPSKGELAAVLEKDKNSVLVLEQTEIEPLKPDQRMQVLLHHVTKTGERFGPPRIFIVPRNITLIALRGYLLERIEVESYQFEYKTYVFNPFKLRFVIYSKDQSKGIELPEEGMEPEPTQQQGKTKNGTPDTLQSKFGKCKFVRVAVTHSYIAKGSQVLKLNVE